MQLFQHVLQLLRDRQPQVRGILHQGNTLIGDVEEDHRSPQHRAASNPADESDDSSDDEDGIFEDEDGEESETTPEPSPDPTFDMPQIYDEPIETPAPIESPEPTEVIVEETPVDIPEDDEDVPGDDGDDAVGDKAQREHEHGVARRKIGGRRVAR